MPTWYFTALERFTPAKGQEWQTYLRFSGFTHIKELISRDTILCPELVTELIDEDWSYNVHADNRCFMFIDYEYLIRRVGYDSSRHNILAIHEEPEEFLQPPVGFEHVGYDILDEFENISVLTNCGPFPEIFQPAEVNGFGLLADITHAQSVAASIRQAHPDDPHCKACKVWQIAKYSHPA